MCELLYPNGSPCTFAKGKDPMLNLALIST
ncbi:hypothetical protein J2W46_007013 [Paraburkholderia strydomiana]|nr:hypothetical protein [Paraburkholderia strydomiana]